MLTFREELESLLTISIHGPDIVKTSRPFLSLTPMEEISTPDIVLRCLRQLHSVYSPD
jgi:hypothetical protein